MRWCTATMVGSGECRSCGTKPMSGNRTSSAKLPRSSSSPGVIQLRPSAQPATVGGQNSAELRLQVRLDVLAYQVAVELAGDEVRGRRLRHDDVDDLDAIEVAGLAEEGLGAVVMLLGVHHEGEIVGVPAG